MPENRVYEAWHWTNPSSERNEDLLEAKKTRFNERKTLDSAKRDVIENNPPHEAFIDVYEIDKWEQYNLIDRIDDPRR